MPEDLQRIVVAVDPPAASTKMRDACGIVAVGLGGDGMVHVLADASVKQAAPDVWAAAAVRLYHGLQADCILAEVNQGGDMVESVSSRTVDANVPVKPVRAQRGKWLRAEPVAALYEQGRVRHCRASLPSWKTKCAISAGMALAADIRRTGWMRWSGR